MSDDKPPRPEGYEMQQDDENPCGEIHPLPCGVDKDCGYLENYVSETKLRELVDRMLSNQDGLEDIGTPQALAAKMERKRWADELEQVLEDG